LRSFLEGDGWVVDSGHSVEFFAFRKGDAWVRVFSGSSGNEVAICGLGVEGRDIIDLLESSGRFKVGDTGWFSPYGPRYKIEILKNLISGG